jgi:methylated-DNA-[protein]-cysteine S-methyltransferase
MINIHDIHSAPVAAKNLAVFGLVRRAFDVRKPPDFSGRIGYCRLMSEHRLFLEYASTPVGVLRLVTDADGVLRRLDWGEDDQRQFASGAKFAPHPGVSEPHRALKAYFAGDIAALTGLAAQPEGTEFQRRVWTALREIPAGATASYGEIASQVGRKQAARAVGMANNRNPVAIVIPCHRVIGANGALVGYGGGLDRKLWLLRHEGALF